MLLRGLESFFEGNFAFYLEIKSQEEEHRGIESKSIVVQCTIYTIGDSLESHTNCWCWLQEIERLNSHLDILEKFFHPSTDRLRGRNLIYFWHLPTLTKMSIPTLVTMASQPAEWSYLKPKNNIQGTTKREMRDNRPNNPDPAGAGHIFLSDFLKILLLMVFLNIYIFGRHRKLCFYQV